MPSSSLRNATASELSVRTTHEGLASDHVSLLQSDQNEDHFRGAEKATAVHRHMARTQWTWKTPFAIVGSYCLGKVAFFNMFPNAVLISTIAAVLVISHYGFFRWMDGQDDSDTFMLRQSQVTTVSFLLVTAFRASIVTALGISFTQYLWYLLRRNCLQVDLIESLFQIRSNAMGLFNHKIVRHAPVLFITAALSWIVPLATIYPPGALTIRSEPHVFVTGVNASIMNPSPLDFNVSGSSSLAQIARGMRYHGLGGGMGERGYVMSTYRSVSAFILNRIN
jgi:hypothetical protein